MVQFKAWPIRTAYSTTLLLRVGRVPGIPRQMGQQLVFTSEPKAFLQPQ